MMGGLFDGWPFPAAVTVLTLIAFGRGVLTCLLGRAAEAGAQRTRIRQLVESDGFQRARRLINRWGPPVVSVSFLTVGFQTLVNVAAGVGRMPWRRYLPALAVGAVLWGLLYATVGAVTFAAWFRLYELSPAGAIVVLVVALLALTFFVLSQLRGVRATRQETDHDSNAADAGRIRD
jgi:membrane protein DedA with SNARE-associated domain